MGVVRCLLFVVLCSVLGVWCLVFAGCCDVSRLLLVCVIVACFCVCFGLFLVVHCSFCFAGRLFGCCLLEVVCWKLFVCWLFVGG